MNIYTIVTLVILTAALVLFAVRKYLPKNFFNYYKVLMPVAKALYEVIAAIHMVCPSDELNVAAEVMRAAIEGTVKAEELWKTQNLTKEERNAYAKQYISSAMVLAGIEPTPAISQIIDGIIALVCIILPSEQELRESGELPTLSE